MKIREFKMIGMAMATVLLWIPLAGAAVIIKANNTDNLNLGSSWIGGVVPGSGDIAVWDNNVLAANSVNLGVNLSFSGLKTDISHTNGSITIFAGNTLTVGADGVYHGITNASYKTIINAPVILACPQTWTANSGTLQQGQTANGINTAGYTLTLTGGGTKLLYGPISGGGDIIVNGGTMQMNGGGGGGTGSTAPASTVTVNPGSYIKFDTSTGSASTSRTANIILNGGNVIETTPSFNSIDTNANTITVNAGGGISTIGLTQGYAWNGQLYAGSLVRNAGSLLWLKGLNLGMNSLASKTVSSVNIGLGTAPALVGAGGAAGTPTCSIMAGCAADTNYSPTSYNTSFLATYDSTYGVRPLNSSSEYASTISDGSAVLNNVRLVNTSGSVVTTTVNSATAINSLSLYQGVAGSGLLLNGAGTLTINSGMILVGDTNASAAATTTILTNLTLDLNGREGTLIFGNSGSVAGGNMTGCILELDAKITNDGGNGLTTGGSGAMKISGPLASDYTGPTTHLANHLWLSKSGVNAIPGNLQVTGGYVYDTGNQIADSSDITIAAMGSFYQRVGSTGSGSSEMFRDLFMSGGSYYAGYDSASTFYTTNRNAFLSGGTFAVYRGQRVTMSGQLILSGGLITVTRGNDTAGYSTSITVSNGVVITNIASGVYTPITLSSSDRTTATGGRLILPSDLTFIGSANTNTVTVAATTPTGGGFYGAIALAGSRTFTVGDGAATNDLTVNVPLVDGSPAGGLTKTGAGTLVLNGTNSYSGATVISNGTLAVNTFLASPATVSGSGVLVLNGVVTNTVTVNSNAVLTGTGVVSAAGSALTVNAGGIVDPGVVGGIGTLTVTGNVYFAGGLLRLDATGPNTNDLLAVTGTVTAASSPVLVTVNAVGDGPWKVMTAANIAPTFTTTSPDMILNKRAGDTELWLYRGVRGSTLIIQ